MHQFLRRLFLVIAAALLAPPSLAAVTQENNVVILVNSNSLVSIAIGNQYKSIHPGANIATLSMPTTEVITQAQYQTLQGQVQNYLSTNSRLESTHYLVTTKGMPLKIDTADGSEFTAGSTFSSVDSELTLAGYDYVAAPADRLSLLPGRQFNPYRKFAINQSNQISYQAPQTFADFKAAQQSGTATKAFYLTSRLDAFTQQDVFNMLARAQKRPGALSGTYVIDDDQKTYDQMEALSGFHRGAKEEIEARGGTTYFDDTNAALTGPINGKVIGYLGHGTNGSHPPGYIANLGFTYQDGAVFSSYESWNASSFVQGQNRNGQGLVAEFIQAGGTAATGHTWEPFTDGIAHEEIFFPNLMDGYDFADSMWMATRYVSWQNVMVGDPLMVIVPEPAGPALMIIAVGALARRQRRDARNK